VSEASSRGAPLDRNAFVKLLLQAGADVNTEGGRLVLLAIECGVYGLVRGACQAAPGPIVTSGEALNAALAKHDAHTFRQLFPLTDISCINQLQALQFAIHHNCVKIVQHLLERGVDPNLEGGAPLAAALRRQQVPIAALLLQHGAEVEAGQEEGLISLTAPQVPGSHELIRELESRGILPASPAAAAAEGEAATA
jgi:ankyrin repeat protein